MSTTFGELTGNIIPQTGFSPRQDATGGWTATRDYRMTSTTFDTNTTGTFSRGVSITTLDSTVESYWAFLKIESKEVIYEEAGHVVVRIHFSGANSGQFASEELSEDATPDYSLAGSLTETPLSDHPKFVELDEFERSTLGKLIKGQVEYLYDPFDLAWGIYWPRSEQSAGHKLPAHEQLTTADAIAFAQLINEGANTYLRPSFTWTEKTQGNTGLNSAQLNLLGRVSTPRGNPPEPSGTRNWLLTSATQDQRGELYQTRIEWTLSERGGHNEFLYTATP